MVKINLFKKIGKHINFQRRSDLTPDSRLYIAFKAKMNSAWGTITDLATQFCISRTFVYMLEKQLNTVVLNAFGDTNSVKTDYTIQERNLQSIGFTLSLRMEGKCSIPAISSILKRFDLPFNSVGSISQTLDFIGSNLPNTIQSIENEHSSIYVYLACDEIFTHSRPILISVDPISSAIMRIELAESRETHVWVEHFNSLKEKGVNIIKVVSDEAIPINAAVEQTVENNRQPDTFHAVSHRLGKWINTLESSAYAAIAQEYHQGEIFDSAKTELVIQKRIDHYLQAKHLADKAICLYEDFKFLYHCILEQLLVFDNHGNPRNRQIAQDEIRIALDFMICLTVPEKLKKSINTIYNLLDDLLAYLDDAQQLFKELVYQGIDEWIIRLFALAMQYEKNHIKAKNTPRKNYFNDKYKNQLELLKQVLGADFENIKTKIYTQFSKIIQSSAIVENINSIVRSYLNTSRNHINQNMLNLIMFYHNNRIYKAGKRKGYSPMELLTGEKNKDFIELILEKYKTLKYYQQAA